MTDVYIVTGVPESHVEAVLDANRDVRGLVLFQQECFFATRDAGGS